MAFMVPQYETGEWYEIDSPMGTTWVPVGVIGDIDESTTEEFTPYLEYPADPEEMTVKRVNGTGCRLSAPGYMDCTDWVLCGSLAQAREVIKDTFEVDPDTGDEFDEGN